MHSCLPSGGLVHHDDPLPALCDATTGCGRSKCSRPSAGPSGTASRPPGPGRRAHGAAGENLLLHTRHAEFLLPALCGAGPSRPRCPTQPDENRGAGAGGHEARLLPRETLGASEALVFVVNLTEWEEQKTQVLGREASSSRSSLCKFNCSGRMMPQRV